MTQQEVFERLQTLSEQEQFYKKYAQTEANPSARRMLLGGLDRERAVREHWLLPELYPERHRMEFSDDDFFDDAPRYHVRLTQHPRYEPRFPVSYDFFSAVYVMQGGCELRIMDDLLTLPSGSFCLVAPGVTHTLKVSDESTLVFHILLRKSTFQELLSDILQSDSRISAFFFNTLYTGQSGGYLLFSTGEDPTVRQLILAMFGEQMEKDVYSNILINHSLIMVLTRLIREYEHTVQTPPAAKSSDECFQLLYYLMNNFLDLSLADVAEHYNYNVSYCSQYIKRITGKTFSQLMKIFRIRKACELLTGSGMDIHEISELLGYANPESFMLAFKKEMHMTPTQYRRGS